MRTIPAIGEQLEAGKAGTFVVAKVIHTPTSTNQEVILILNSETGMKAANQARK